jgi:hypothetical protein
VELLIGNNTFYELQTAIRWTDMPQPTSHGLGVYRNLFDKIDGPEVLVEKNYEAAKFYSILATSPGGWQDNWSTRPAPTEAAPGEVDVFTSRGRYGAAIRHASTAPGSPEFLAPAEDAPGRTVQGTFKNLKPYVGAVAP